VLASIERMAIAGEPHVLLMLQDFSDRARVETQMRQSQKMEAIGQLASGHRARLNNLLTNHRRPRQPAARCAGINPDVADSLTQIEQAAERAAVLTRQLLAFSQRRIIRPRVLDLNDLLSNGNVMLKRILGEGVEFRCTLAVTCRRFSRIRQALRRS
jgi:C4-dicarboxylate-specific signal transduction histidine kinase